MAKYVMLVQSAAMPGQDDAYNEWQDKFHFKEICAIPGMTGGRRFEATPIAMGAPGAKYLSIYEIETDDPGALLGEIGKRSQDGSMTQSDALDKGSAILWIYKQHDVE